MVDSRLRRPLHNLLPGYGNGRRSLLTRMTRWFSVEMTGVKLTSEFARRWNPGYRWNEAGREYD